ncbi:MULTISPECIES: hypothetical protein [Cryobacterium]|nr:MULTISPECIES: hypothetical protein [Cryobacterium]
MLVPVTIYASMTTAMAITVTPCSAPVAVGAALSWSPIPCWR